MEFFHGTVAPHTFSIFGPHCVSVAGTFENGEMRLLFSSGQIEYLRYWLHAMRLTEKLIPIPSSEYLIQASDLTNVSPNVYDNSADLKRAIKVRFRTRARRNTHSCHNLIARARTRACHPIEACSPQLTLVSYSTYDVHDAFALMIGAVGTWNDTVENGADDVILTRKNLDKNNKKIQRGHGAGTMLVARRLAFERVRTLWSLKTGTWLSIDFEAWDKDHTALTEFGYSLIRWENDEQVKEDGHFIVKEHCTFLQTYVPNHRDVRDCLFTRIAHRADFVLLSTITLVRARSSARDCSSIASPNSSRGIARWARSSWSFTTLPRTSSASPVCSAPLY